MISVVIVNWNSGGQLAEALSSVALYQSGLVDSVIVVDNASSDDSLNFLDHWRPEGFDVEVVRNSVNKGFGAACNQGAAFGVSKYILFLNPDARLFEGSLPVPLNFMEAPENSDVGICGVQLIDDRGVVSRTCARFPSFSIFLAQATGLSKLPGHRFLGHGMEEWDHGTDRDVDQLIGAFFFIRREVFDLLGGFDERFFVYFEEVDVSYRARQAGLRSVYLTGAQAFHEGGGTSRQVKAKRLFYSLRSRLLYGFKHFSPAAAWGLVGVTLLVEPLSRTLFALLSGGMENVRNTLRGYKMLWDALPAILRGQGR